MRPHLIIFILTAFILNSIGPMPVHAQGFTLPKPGVMVRLSPTAKPTVLRAITVHPENPFLFDFIVEPQKDTVISAKAEIQNKEQLKAESEKLIRYFLASLAMPEEDLWVNLSPYEKDRIIPESFGKTEMGRDLLAQDYLLKQITASLIYPEGETGKVFWEKIYAKAKALYGRTDIPVNTFNKVWIMPDVAKVYEKGQTCFIVKSSLKVMLEQDYLAFEKNAVIARSEGTKQSKENLESQKDSIEEPDKAWQKQVIREVVIPVLEKEINEGANFAPLRQVYNSLILATWFKQKMKQSLLGQKYVNQRKVAGVGYSNSLPPVGRVRKGGDSDIEAIYQQYLQAFKKGAYNYIKEEIDPLTQEIIPKKYFSGGYVGVPSLAMATPIDAIKEKSLMNDGSMMVRVKLQGDVPTNPIIEKINRQTLQGRLEEKDMTIAVLPLSLQNHRQKLLDQQSGDARLLLDYLLSTPYAHFISKETPLANIKGPDESYPVMWTASRVHETRNVEIVHHVRIKGVGSPNAWPYSIKRLPKGQHILDTHAIWGGANLSALLHEERNALAASLILKSVFGDRGEKMVAVPISVRRVTHIPLNGELVTTYKYFQKWIKENDPKMMNLGYLMSKTLKKKIDISTPKSRRDLLLRFLRVFVPAQAVYVNSFCNRVAGIYNLLQPGVIARPKLISEKDGGEFERFRVFQNQMETELGLGKRVEKEWSGFTVGEKRVSQERGDLMVKSLLEASLPISVSGGYFKGEAIAPRNVSFRNGVILNDFDEGDFPYPEKTSFDEAGFLRSFSIDINKLSSTMFHLSEIYNPSDEFHGKYLTGASKPWNDVIKKDVSKILAASFYALYVRADNRLLSAEYRGKVLEFFANRLTINLSGSQNNHHFVAGELERLAKQVIAQTSEGKKDVSGGSAVNQAMNVKLRDLGGIDFNPNKIKLDVARDAEMVGSITESLGNDMDWSNVEINGLSPFVIEMKPANLQALLN